MTNQNDDLRRTDPGFAERMLHFADVEVAQDPDTALDPQTRYLAILATLLGCQGADEFRIQLVRALDSIGRARRALEGSVRRICDPGPSDSPVPRGSRLLPIDSPALLIHLGVCMDPN